MGKFVKNGLLLTFIISMVIFSYGYLTAKSNYENCAKQYVAEYGLKNSAIDIGEDCNTFGFPLTYYIPKLEINLPFLFLDFIGIPIILGFGISYVKNNLVRK